MIPKRVFIVEELPKNLSGKILKRTLSAAFDEAAGEAKSARADDGGRFPASVAQ